MKKHPFVLVAAIAAAASLEAKTVFEENFMQYADYAPRLAPDKGIRCGTDPIWKQVGQVDVSVKAPCNLFRENIPVPENGFNVTCRFKLNAKQPKTEKNKETGEVKVVEKGTTVARTEDRTKLWAVQTPQAFSASIIRRAYANVAAKKLDVTDDASAVELLGEPVKIFETNTPNLKITTVEDLQIAAAVVLKS